MLLIDKFNKMIMKEGSDINTYLIEVIDMKN